MVATPAELEARIAALEASQADYGAVLAAVNALGANQREHGLGLAEVTTGLSGVKSELTEVKIGFADFRQETRSKFRSVDEQLAEIKDLIIGRRNSSVGPPLSPCWARFCAPHAR